MIHTTRELEEIQKNFIEMEVKSFAREVIEFIDESPSTYHVVKNCSDILDENGFERIMPREKWEIKKGGKYFLKKSSSTIIAFTVGEDFDVKNGFKIFGAHTDSPCFRIKPNPEIVTENVVRLNTEVYGGPILSTWFDRPLSFSGRVFVESDNAFKPKKYFINYDKDLFIIPSLCIHQNRGVNDGMAINAQKDTLPLVTITDEKEKFSLKKLLAKQLKVKEDKILSYDLNLYSREKGCLLGANEEFISVGRLDNLAALHAGLMSLVDNKDKKNTCVVVGYDNEEIGSNSIQGADSPTLKNILERISNAMKLSFEEHQQALANSFVISNDAAHSIHPNYLEKSDPTNEPKINAGPVIKMAANKSYITDGYSKSVIEKIAKDSKIPIQTFVNRSDVRGGSTIGPIQQSQIRILGIDIGSPLLSMHSVRELGGVDDHYNLYRLISEFFKI